MKKLCTILSVLFLLPLYSIPQIGIQNDFPDPSAELDITSADKGLLIPRVELTNDLTNPAPVTNPAVGLLVFNIGTNQVPGFYYWNGDGWYFLRADPPTGSYYTRYIIQCYNITPIMVNHELTPQAITWDGEDFKDPDGFMHSNTVNPSRIYFQESGVYEISYAINIDADVNHEYMVSCKVRKNGSTYISRGPGYAGAWDKVDDKQTNGPGTFCYIFFAGEYIEILTQAEGSWGDAWTIPYQSHIYVKLIKEF